MTAERGGVDAEGVNINRDTQRGIVVWGVLSEKKRGPRRRPPALRGLPRTAARNLICGGARAACVYPPPVFTSRGMAAARCGSADRPVTHLVGQTFVMQEGENVPQKVAHEPKKKSSVRVCEELCDRDSGGRSLFLKLKYQY